MSTQSFQVEILQALESTQQFQVEVFQGLASTQSSHSGRSTPGTREYSVISLRSKYARDSRVLSHLTQVEVLQGVAISGRGTLLIGTLENSVISARSTPGTEAFNMTGTPGKLTDYQLLLALAP